MSQNLVDQFVEQIQVWIPGHQKPTDFRTQIVLGTENVNTHFLGWKTEPTHFRAIKHLETKNVKSGTTFFFVDRSRFEDSFPKPFWNWNEVLPSGKLPEFEEAGYSAYYQSVGEVFIFIHPVQNWAVWVCGNEKDLPEWELAAPYRLLFQHWFKSKNLLLLHSASVALSGKAVLLVGPGGKGKSTTSLACLQAGLQYLGDDFVIINPNSLEVHSLYQSGKISPGLVASMPELLPFFNSKVAEKQCLFVGDSRPGQMLQKADLVAILVLDFQANWTTSGFIEIGKSEAFKALIPNTLALLHEDLGWIQRANTVISGLTCYRLQTGTDFASIATTVQDILQNQNA